MLLLALRLHEDAISECMSKICDGGQEWKVEFWKSEKSLNECRIEFTESSLPRGEFLFVCLVLLFFYKQNNVKWTCKFIMTKMK